MRKALFAVALSFMFVLVTAAPALADRVQANAQWSWSHDVTGGTFNLTAKCQVNQNELSGLPLPEVEARLILDGDGSTTGTFKYDVDYVQLLKDGNVEDAATGTGTTTPPPFHRQVDTGWNTTGDSQPHTYKAVCRFRVRHIHGSVTHTAGWQTLRTPGWVH